VSFEPPFGSEIITMKRIRLIPAAVLFVAFSCTGALAATQSPGQQVAGQVDSPDAGSTAANFTPKALVNVSTDKTTATVSISHMHPFEDGKDAAHVVLTVTAPFDSSKSNEQDLGSLSGLTAGTNARLEFSYLKWPHFLHSKEEEIDSTCSEYVGKVLPGYYWSRTPGDSRPAEHNVARPEIGMSCYTILTSAGLQQLVKALNDVAAAAAKTNGGPAPPSIAAVPNPDPILSEGQSKILALNNEGFVTAHQFALALTGNDQKFSYASPAAPAQVTNATKNGAGISLTYSAIWSKSVLALGASYEKSYTGAQTTQICTPVGTTGATQCSSGALSPPTESVNRLVFVEYRSWLGADVLGTGLNLAFSPRVEYSTSTSDLAAKVPFYIVQTGSQSVNGGITLAWDKKSHFGAAVFVSKPFTFFDNGS
jgi:hypothetical protein